jgi:hypothetical protein
MTRVNDWLIERFNKLKYRITFTTSSTQDDYSRSDVIWVKAKLIDLSHGIVLDKLDLKKANHLWKRYSNNPPTDVDWDLIDDYLKVGKKINAIKIYKGTTNLRLREAKDAIDTREIELRINKGTI